MPRTGRPPKPLSRTLSEFVIYVDENNLCHSLATEDEFEALRGLDPNSWPEKFLDRHWGWAGSVTDFRIRLQNRAGRRDLRWSSPRPVLRGNSAAKRIYEHLLGPIPEHHRLHSLCGHPACVSPLHRELRPIAGRYIFESIPNPTTPDLDPEIEDLIGLAKDFLTRLHDNPGLTPTDFGLSVEELRLAEEYINHA